MINSKKKTSGNYALENTNLLELLFLLGLDLFVTIIESKHLYKHLYLNRIRANFSVITLIHPPTLN